jgi:hypothetical protein
MSTESRNDYIFVDATPIMQSLAHKARNETRAQAAVADQSPVSKLTYTAGCGEVTTEYYKAHHQVRHL